MTSRIFHGICALLLALCCSSPSQAQEEETYSISLTKTAETQEGKKIHEIDDKKVLATEVTVQDGDHLWQLLRERGLLEKQDLPELLSTLKRMNHSLQNLNLIHPGEKIIIPLKIVPIAGGAAEEQTAQIEEQTAQIEEQTVPLDELKDIEARNYTVKQDDHLIQIVKGFYNIPEEDLYKDYLELVKQMNPSIKDLNTIYPGQTIRLPIYSPEVVRAPIRAATTSVKDVKEQREDVKSNPVAHDLAEIFKQMGEEWVQSGEHFIPLKTGGQINLKASSFPIINRKNGHRVLVDLNSKLPPKMARLIESSWNNYRVVPLKRDDDLRGSLDKIIKGCQYPKVLGRGEPLELGKNIPLRITGDWIINLTKTGSDLQTRSIVINLKEPTAPNTPKTLKDYLSGFGVKIIDYPPGDDITSAWTDKVAPLKAENNPSSIIKTVLDLAGKPYTSNEQIPAYENQKADIKMVINADFFLKIKEKDAVIDLSGLEPEVISLLDEQHVMTLSLAKEKNAVKMVAETCKFLGIPFKPGPHFFTATPGDDSKNIKLTLPGVTFLDSKGESILVTPANLPDEINAFLYHKGYRVLVVSLS